MMASIFKKPLPYLAILLANIIWGANTVVAKITLQEFPVFALGFFRFALASLLILPFFLTERKNFKIKTEHLPKLFLIGLTLITLNIAFFYEGVTRITAISASVLSMLIPIISVVGGWWFLKEKIYGINLFGIILGLLGTIVIAGLPMVFFGGLTGEMVVGSLFLLLSDIFYVIGAILCKQMLKTYSSLAITSIVFLVGFVTFALPAIHEYLIHPDWVGRVTILGILGLLFIVVLSSICAYFIFQWGLSKVDLYRANLFQYVEPAVTATLAVFFLSERISYSFIVGTILIVLGVYWGTLGKLEHHHFSHRHHRT